jgi:hypothetical protein
LRLLAIDDHRWRRVKVRARRYLDNVVEQDHRASKQRCAPMLGLKSFRSAAITLAGVELAHRVRKQQYSLPTSTKGRAGSLKELWEVALADSGAPMCRDADRSAPMHQNSADRFRLARERVRPDGSVRYPRKISFGGSLYLLVRPRGGRYWRYRYRYGGKAPTRCRERVFMQGPSSANPAEAHLASRTDEILKVDGAQPPHDPLRHATLRRRRGIDCFSTSGAVAPMPRIERSGRDERSAGRAIASCSRFPSSSDRTDRCSVATARPAVARRTC